MLAAMNSAHKKEKADRPPTFLKTGSPSWTHIEPLSLLRHLKFKQPLRLSNPLSSHKIIQKLDPVESIRQLLLCCFAEFLIYPISNDF